MKTVKFFNRKFANEKWFNMLFTSRQIFSIHTWMNKLLQKTFLHLYMWNFVHLVKIVTHTHTTQLNSVVFIAFFAWKRRACSHNNKKQSFLCKDSGISFQLVYSLNKSDIAFLTIKKGIHAIQFTTNDGFLTWNFKCCK